MFRMSVWFIIGMALALTVACASRPDSGSLSVGDSTAGRGAARVSAVNGKRFALVIGNGAYPESPLSNALNDSTGMKAALQKLGFQVIYLENADMAEMDNAVHEFTKLLQPDSEGLFYFSGHGAQTDGANYLIPLNASIANKAELKARAYNAGIVLENMREHGNRFNLVILDACRDNPFKGFKTAVGGLTGMSGPAGTLIAFASAPDTPASNNKRENNSVYTKHMLRYITEPGLKIEDMLKKVRLSVSEDTHGEQIPWENGSLMGDFCFAGCAGASESQAEQKLRVAEKRIQQLERQYETPKSSAVDGGVQRSSERNVVGLPPAIGGGSGGGQSKSKETSDSKMADFACSDADSNTWDYPEYDITPRNIVHEGISYFNKMHPRYRPSGLCFPSFNNAVDSNGYGDERKFLKVQLLTSKNVKLSEWQDSISANPGDVVSISANISNDGFTNDSRVTAYGVITKISGFYENKFNVFVSSPFTKAQKFTQSISASNTTPTTVSDSITISSATGKPIRLWYKPSNMFIESAMQKNPQAYTLYERGILTSGASIGNNGQEVSGNFEGTSMYTYLYFGVESAE